jgi:hypothetical protein
MNLYHCKNLRRYGHFYRKLIHLQKSCRLHSSLLHKYEPQLTVSEVLSILGKKKKHDILPAHYTSQSSGQHFRLRIRNVSEFNLNRQVEAFGSFSQSLQENTRMMPLILLPRLPWATERRVHFRDYIPSDGRMMNWKEFGRKLLYPTRSII